MSDGFDQPRLTAAVDFTPDELALNRAGRVSARQHTKLTRMRRSTLLGLTYVGVIAIGFVVFVLVYLEPKLTTGAADAHSTRTDIRLAVGVIVGLFVLSAARTLLRVRRLVSGPVRQVVGPVRTRAHLMRANITDGGIGPEYGGGLRHELTVGRKMFIVRGRATLGAFVDGATYRAYYTGGTRFMTALLSVERLA